MGVRCQDCFFWEEGTDEERVKVRYRQCRRAPPQIADRTEDFGDMGSWPYTPSGAWCGEFKDRWVRGVGL